MQPNLCVLLEKPASEYKWETEEGCMGWHRAQQTLSIKRVNVSGPMGHMVCGSYSILLL